MWPVVWVYAEGTGKLTNSNGTGRLTQEYHSGLSEEWTEGQE